MSNFVQIGACSAGYQSYEKWDEKGKTQIIQIIASYGPEQLHSLQFHYLENGRVLASPIIGSSTFNGNMFNTITFEGSNEYITKVEGLYNGHSASNSYTKGFQKLIIHTNMKVYEIFSIKSSSSKSFSFNFGGLNQFGGFYGTHSSSGVDSIGVYFKQLTTPPKSIGLVKDVAKKLTI